MHVGDAIFLSHGFHASSDGQQAAVRMRGATVEGQIIMWEGRFTSPLAWAFATLFVAGFTGLVRRDA